MAKKEKKERDVELYVEILQ